MKAVVIIVLCGLKSLVEVSSVVSQSNSRQFIINNSPLTILPLHPKHLKISNFTYELPDERIAKYPLHNRDESKLLCYREGVVSQRVFKTLSEELSSDALLVYNNTKVIRARMLFHKVTGAKIEIFCLEPHIPVDYALSFQQTKQVVWRCMVGGARKWKEDKLTMVLFNGTTLTAERKGREQGDFLIQFTWDNAALTFSDVIEQSGNIPIPPYLNRPSEASDLTTYQTVYAKHKGSVAAPTAGLHFTDEVLSDLHEHGIEIDEVTLHVGAGTFQPVKAVQMDAHNMHTETIAVSLETIKHLKAKVGHIIAVGTTSVRTLESLYWIGNHYIQGDIDSPDAAHLDQWTPYNEGVKHSTLDVFEALEKWMLDNGVNELHASTQIIIAPSYQFRVIEGMLTNFHQPNSTLLLLVSALVGDDWRKIYDYALAHDFRFLSYGDSSLLMSRSSKGQEVIN